ncbi:hypothetical protein [Flavilitoribacter nigricans]|uniref:Uncharacterized protein n=1 Tax=Flavilitoribacter nigricans (strain ATCC 23147 / DSM 23189 / NBRC 102662 / NCIMB 1420 / SS-2) TaxID=1122177 RepID=A0A2D0N813_FLAN2|nr:hypothetical protein [Flavilitoribacter nigricans]PHN03883.1 hypothetical protein CRP01_23705 [Flavilitoribacter nigricans DSM 23189 = NBRC 102662]
MEFRRILLMITLLFLFSHSGFSQLDRVSGFWKGTFTCPKTGEDIEIELQLVTSPRENGKKDRNYVLGAARGSGKQRINDRLYDFQFNSFVHKDNSITARIYRLTEEKQKDPDPSLGQDVILLLEKRNGKYVMTGNWVYQDDASRDCARGNITLERTRSTIRP